MTQTRIRAVFFDAGNTLLHPVRSPAAIYAQSFRAHGLPAREEEVDVALRRAWKECNRDRESGDDKFYRYDGGERAFWRDFVQRVVAELGEMDRFDECFNELYEWFRRPDAWTIDVEAPGLLTDLKRRGYILGIVSNWDSSLLSILDAHRVTPLFSTVLISSIIGVSKPDPMIFRLAARNVSIPPEECLHVGDSLFDDIHGARTAGLQAVLFDRGGIHDGRHRSIRSLSEVLQWLN